MAPMIELDGSNSTASLTLMSTDVERVARGLLNIHEIWACMIELGLALYLLQRELGEAFLAAVITFIACTVVIVWLSRWGRKQQRLWMSRIQDRVGLTATVLAHMKSIEMSGMTDCITELIQPLRVNELAAGRQWRVFLVIAASLAQVPSTLTPAAALVLAPGGLEASKIFREGRLRFEPILVSFRLLSRRPTAQYTKAAFRRRRVINRCFGFRLPSGHKDRSYADLSAMLLS
ncbi:hypothetical protein ANO14919_110060 [Xylariales sp. No.14919]|nr:hypothetical protein ANO14919_110060 [Xylariales sp. No.14919]